MRQFATVLLVFCALGASAGERVHINSMGGDIDVEDATSGASLRTMGGDIRIGRAGADVVAKTMGGQIDVRELTGDLEAGSMGGDVRVHVTASNGHQQIALRSMGGEIELTVPRDFDATFNVVVHESTARDPGVIESDFPLKQTIDEHWSFWHGTERTITATKTTSSQRNHVEISTYGSRVVIHRQ